MALIVKVSEVLSLCSVYCWKALMTEDLKGAL